jgi:hypothetical protein
MAPPSAPIIKGSGLLAALVAAIALNPAALTSTLAMLVGSMPRIVDVPSPVETLAAPDPAAGAPLDVWTGPPDDACTAGRGGWFGGRCTVLGVAGPAWGFVVAGGGWNGTIAAVAARELNWY